jgi:hypothetical protein
MKRIEQKKEGDFTTAKLLQQVCETSINGMNLTQMRSRIRVLDAVEAAGDGDIMLEDADFNTLSEAINSQQWALAKKQLLVIIDGVLEAKNAEPAQKEK